jgi:hypothetical protein
MARQSKSAARQGRAAWTHFGTISHGTLRIEDLVPAALRALDIALDWCRVHAPRGAAADKQVTNAHFVASDVVEHMKEGGDYYAKVEDYYESEDAIYDYEALVDVINSLLPEGVYFGAIEGDGSDIGFWHTDVRQNPSTTTTALIGAGALALAGGLAWYFTREKK